MRKFKTCMFGEVDLDDPKTYSRLPQNVDELRDMMFAKIGYAHCYMNFWHSDWFINKKKDGGQKLRVKGLIKYFTDNEKENYSNVMWYQEQIFLFEDETENMC